MRIVTIVAVVCLGPSGVAQAVEPVAEIIAITKARHAIASAARTDALPSKALVAQCLALTNVTFRRVTRPFTQQRALAFADVLRGLEGTIRTGLSQIFRTSRAARAEQIDLFLRQITSPEVVETEVARWLGVPLPGTVPPPGGANDPVKAVSAGLVISGGLHGFVSGRGVRLLEDRGGAGAGNAVADAGEWLRIAVAIENAGAPLFSTSAWVRAVGPCLWVDDAREIGLAEMHRRGEHVTLETWVYASRVCPNTSPRVLEVIVRDTHRVGDARIRVRVPVHHVDLQAVATRVDADLPGASDGAGAPLLIPGRQFELSARWRVRSDWPVEGATVGYAVQGAMTTALNSVSFDDGRLRVGPQGLEPSDDIDIHVGSHDSLGRAQRQPLLKRWIEGASEGVFWIAADIRVVTRRQSSGRAPTVSPPSPPTLRPVVPSAQAVIGLLRRHISWRSRRVQPTGDEVLGAVAGHETVFDAVGFAKNWSALTVVEGPAPRPPRKRPLPAAGYVLRRYIAVPVIAAVAPPTLPNKPPRPAKTTEPPTVGPWLRLNIGLGLSSFSLEPSSNPRWWNESSETALRISANATMGRTVAAAVTLDYSGGSPVMDGGVETSLSEVYVGAGLAYIVRAGRHFEFVPRLTAGVTARSLDAGDGPETVFKRQFSSGKFHWEVPSSISFAVELAAVIRIPITPRVGLFLEGGGLFTGVGPTMEWSDGAGDGNDELLSGTVVRFGGGIALQF